MCIDNNKLLYLKPQTVKRKPVKITNMILQAELFFPEFWCTFYRASVERSVFCSQLGQHAFLTPSYYQFFRNSYFKSIPIWLSQYSHWQDIVEASIEYKLYMTVEIPVYLSEQMLMSSPGNHYHIGIIATFACHNEIY